MKMKKILRMRTGPAAAVDGNQSQQEKAPRVGVAIPGGSRN